MTIKKSAKTVFLFILSVGYIIIGLKVVKSETVLFFIGDKTTGSITSYEYITNYAGEGSHTFAHPVINFTTDSGREATFTNPFPKQKKTYETVIVYYNSDNPQEAVIMDTIYLFVVPLALILSGIFILAASLFKLI